MWVPSHSGYSVVLWQTPRQLFAATFHTCPQPFPALCAAGTALFQILAVPSRGINPGARCPPRGVPSSGGRTSPAAAVTVATRRKRAVRVPPPALARGRGRCDVTRCPGCVSPVPARGRSCCDVTKCPRCGGVCVCVSLSLPAPLPPRTRRGPLRRHGPLPASAPARASRRAPPPRARARARRDVTGGH